MKVKYVSRDAFTLVELLVAIAIIGILAGILIPAVTSVRTSIQTAFLRTECGNLEMAIEAYKLKYGDYPPDFSSQEVVDRHYRRIFPEIADSEAKLLLQICDDIPDENQTTGVGNYDPSIMNRAEAIVWALGGFSSDPQYPFSGPGGPLARIDASIAAVPMNLQYNIGRDDALMDFDPSNLTVNAADSAEVLGFSNRAESSDDGDLFPTYRYREGHAPYVYFDSRTYRAFGEGLINSGVPDFNGYATILDGAKLNAVRPILSDRRTTDDLRRHLDADGNTTGLYCLHYFEFANPNTFQILSPGLDGVYGDRLGLPNRGPLYWQYPAGNTIEPLMGQGYDPQQEGSGGLLFLVGDDPASDQCMLGQRLSRYDSTSLPDAGLDAFLKDNVASFTSRSFEDDLP